MPNKLERHDKNGGRHRRSVTQNFEGAQTISGVKNFLEKLKTNLKLKNIKSVLIKIAINF